MNSHVNASMDKLPLNPDGGCSGKIPKHILQKTLKNLPDFKDSRVLIDGACGDDAGVILLDETRATVLTIDIFSPVTDNPYDFGQIAAANSISDIYAMGATPETALSFIAFPSKTLPMELMSEVLRGGADKLAEANIKVIGGHTIQDSNLKCGYAVVGSIDKARVTQNNNAQLGDVLILTKPLGNGIITFANQHHLAEPAWQGTAVNSMKQLNKTAAELLSDLKPHVITDITGFGLLGHLSNILENSRAAVQLNFDAIPRFPGVKELLCRNVFPRALNHNKESVVSTALDFANLSEPQQNVLFAPETSGGLLVFMAADQAEIYLERLKSHGVHAAIIGRVTATGTDPKVTLNPVTEIWEVRNPVTFKKAESQSGNVCAFTYAEISQPNPPLGEKPFAFMQKLPLLLGGTYGSIIAGFILALCFVALSYFGNPQNMGACVACFVRDVGGAMGFHQFWGGCYIRPEVLGIVLGAGVSAFLFGEFKARTSNNGLISFLLGASGMITSLIFLGCPWRAFGRLFCGDLTALTGVVGLIAGVYVGTKFLKHYTIGTKNIQASFVKWIFPVVFLGLLVLLFVPMHEVPSLTPADLPRISVKGPASFHAPLWISLGAGLLLGFVLQRSRFCTIGGFRDWFLFKRYPAVWGILCFAIGVFIFNYIFNDFHAGFEKQPFAHQFYALSFFAMFTGGITFTLAGGCPGRQLTMAASGDGNSVLFVVGMFAALPLLNALKLNTISPENTGAAWILCGVLLGISVLIGLFVKKS